MLALQKTPLEARLGQLFERRFAFSRDTKMVLEGAALLRAALLGGA